MPKNDESILLQSESRKIKFDPALAHKGKLFIAYIVKLSQKEEVKFAKKELQLTYLSTKALRISDPKRATILITSITIQKAMLALGFTTKGEAKECVEAIGNLAADFGTAALLGPETGGAGAIVPLVLSAIDAYDVGSKCFASDEHGPVTHAVVGQVRSVIKTGSKITKSGQI